MKTIFWNLYKTLALFLLLTLPTGAIAEEDTAKAIKKVVPLLVAYILGADEEADLDKQVLFYKSDAHKNENGKYFTEWQFKANRKKVGVQWEITF